MKRYGQSAGGTIDTDGLVAKRANIVLSSSAAWLSNHPGFHVRTHASQAVGDKVSDPVGVDGT